MRFTFLKGQKRRKRMTLSDVLEKYGNKDCVIEYRTYCTVDSKRTDVLAGMAQYKNKMLISALLHIARNSKHHHLRRAAGWRILRDTRRQ